jgi:hypothetical protein
MLMSRRQYRDHWRCERAWASIVRTKTEYNEKETMHKNNKEKNKTSIGLVEKRTTCCEEINNLFVTFFSSLLLLVEEIKAICGSSPFIGQSCDVVVEIIRRDLYRRVPPNG